MGNKVSGLVFTCQKKHIRSKPKQVGSKAISYVFASKHSNDDDVYFTPKSHRSDTKDYDNYKVNHHDITHEAEEEVEGRNSETDHVVTPTFVCEFCVEPRALYDSFNPQGCSHFYCIGCTVHYVTSKLDDNVTSITCPVPDCGGKLEPEYCRDILPEKVFDRWGIALSESAIDGSQKFYCPFTDCAALLINDGEVEILELSCPSCKRAVCVKCQVPWHSEIDCAKFQKLKKKGEDSMLVDLANRKKWRKCPKCKYYVEKSMGCFYINCRCGHCFCYNCGARSSTTHVCRNCKH